MPVYEFRCNAVECNYEWEIEQSIKDPDPEECPQCKAKGNITHLISSCGGRVELTGHELAAKTKEDARKFQKEVYSSETVYANMIGESKYQKIQTQMDSDKKNRNR